MIPRLVTIPISHYGERARWALDHAGVDYEERHTLQFFSWFSALRAGGRKTLPILVTDGGVLNDSGDIVRWASARAAAPLYPASGTARAQVEAFEEGLSATYAVDTRRIAYDVLLFDIDASLPHNAGRAPPWQVAAFRAGRHPLSAFVRRYLAVNGDTLRRAHDVTDRTLDAVAERLLDGRRYLYGDEIGAADIAFAAFSAPILVPPRYPVVLPALDRLPEGFVAQVRARRLHPAGQFAMRLYDERPAPRGLYVRPLHVASGEWRRSNTNASTPDPKST